MEGVPDLGWLRDLGSKLAQTSRRLKPIVETLAMFGPGGEKHSLKPCKGNDCNKTISDDCVTTETPWPFRP